MLKTVLKQPLLHFILLGIALFVLYYYVNLGTSNQPISSVIGVGQEDLLKFMKLRNQDASPDELRQRLQAMTEDELDVLVDNYVVQEVYYREATFLGLGQDSMNVKQQMAEEFEDLIRKGSEKAAGDRAGEERERFIEERVVNAAAEITKTYSVRVRLEDSPEAVASQNQ